MRVYLIANAHMRFSYRRCGHFGHVFAIYPGVANKLQKRKFPEHSGQEGAERGHLRKRRSS
jgi:hypothetical protein